MDSNQKTELKRKRVKEACLNCRNQKVKCDGVHPTCKRCNEKGLSCSYAPLNKDMKYKVNGPVKDIIKKLSDDLSSYEKIAEQYKMLYHKAQYFSHNSLLFSTFKNEYFNVMNSMPKPKIEKFPLKIEDDIYTLSDELIEICLKIIEDVSNWIEFSEIIFDPQDARKAWKFLMHRDISKHFENMPFENLLFYWEYSIIFYMGSSVVNSNAHDSIMWNHIQTILKILLWQKNYTEHVHLLGRFLFCLIGVSRIFSIQQKNNSSTSCILIAHRISSSSAFYHYVPRGMHEQIKILLILVSNNRSERSQRIQNVINMNIESRFRSAMFHFACCLSGLKIFGNQIDSNEYDELVMNLYSLEDFIEKSVDTIETENWVMLKACTYTLRAELSYRMQSMTEGNQWIDLCIQSFAELTLESTERLLYLLFGRLSVLSQALLHNIAMSEKITEQLRIDFDPDRRFSMCPKFGFRVIKLE